MLNSYTLVNPCVSVSHSEGFQQQN